MESNDLSKIKDELKVNTSANKFAYTGNINYLIDVLSKYKIDDLLIEQPSIEDMFMHFYK